MPASADRLAKIRQGYAKYHEDNPFVVQPGEAETIEFKQPEAMKPRVPNSRPPPWRPKRRSRGGSVPPRHPKAKSTKLSEGMGLAPLACTHCSLTPKILTRMKPMKHVYWEAYSPAGDNEPLPRCKTCDFTIMVGRAPAGATVISCWCGDTEIPFENFEDLDEILAAKSRPPTEEERERRGVSAKRWNLTAPSNVTA